MLHLVGSLPPVVATWVRDLSLLVETVKSYFTSGRRGMSASDANNEYYDNPHLNYSLKSRYTDIYRQSRGGLSTSQAVAEFLTIGQSRACQVHTHTHTHISDHAVFVLI